MNENDFQKIKELEVSFRRLNSKIKLISLLEKAKKEFEQNQLEDCEKTCKELLSKNPKNSTALRGLGCIMQSKGENKKALEYYSQALKYSKNKEIEYTLIGTIFYNQDDFEEAIKYYNLAIDTNDNYDLAYEGRNQSMLEKHLQILDLQDQLIQRKLFK